MLGNPWLLPSKNPKTIEKVPLTVRVTEVGHIAFLSFGWLKHWICSQIFGQCYHPCLEGWNSDSYITWRRLKRYNSENYFWKDLESAWFCGGDSMNSNCLPNLYLFTGKHLNFPSMGCLPKKEASSDYNEAKNMLYVLHISYSYITECIHPTQNALLNLWLYQSQWPLKR